MTAHDFPSLNWDHLSNRIRNAYEWIAAANEIDELRSLTGEDVSTYARECAQNAADHDEDVTEDDVEALWCELDEAARRWAREHE
jgi:predicted lipid-binding transport protein (Tim44 family)